MKLLAVAALLSASLVVAQPPLLPAQQTLRWKLEADQQLTLQLKQDLQSTTTIGSKTLKTQFETEADIQWTVSGVDDDGSARIEQNVTRWVVRTRTPGSEPIVYDSGSAEKPTGKARQLATLLKPLLDATITFTMTDRGEIRDVQLSDEARAALEPAGQGAAELLSPDSILDMVRQTGVVFPEVALAEGDEWTRQLNLDGPFGKATMNAIYRYRGMAEHDGRPLAKIDTDVQMQLRAPAKNGLAQVQITEQKQSGTLWFDPDAGRLISGQLKQQLVVDARYRDQLVRTRLTGSVQTKLE